MGSSMFDDIMAGAVVAKHVFRGASKAYAKAKQVANSEKGQQLKAELRAKTSEAIDLASDKAKEMGLEAKAKYVLDFAKEMVLNTSEPMSPDAQVIVYGPGGYAEKIDALENRIAEETIKHKQILDEFGENMAEDQIREEEEHFEGLISYLQEEIQKLKDELDGGLIMERQRQMEEEAYEAERRQEENARDWAIFLGEDPNKYR